MLKFCASSIAILLLFFVSLSVQAQFRIVGYIHPHVGNEGGKIDFKKLTHLNIAFVNPDSAGNLVLPVGFDSLIISAHRYKVKVLASIGGGSPNPYYSSLLKDENRHAFILKLITMSKEHDLDGIDVDIENDNIDNNYVKLVTELSAQLKPINKLLTSALATWNGERIEDAALSKFDFINVMSYDETGPWKPEKPGPHASYEKAATDLDYWSSTRKVPSLKISLGVPFYGYAFGTKYSSSLPYKEIVRIFPGAQSTDIVKPDEGGALYYNGIPTMQHKTKLALKKAGGIMIWELMQDSNDSLSLLKTINDIVQDTH